MATNPDHAAARLYRALGPSDQPDSTDAELLREYAAGRDEAAFTILVRRYGPMVLGVCRRVTRHTQDAEDAFQVTFLVLARKAADLQTPEALGNWLYGVAYRSALKARENRRRDDALRKQLRHHTPDRPTNHDEIRELIDQAVLALPEKYRVPVILCELQRRPRKAVADQLGLSPGTLSSRLAAARQLLARRLGRAVVLPVVAAVGAELPAALARAAVVMADPTTVPTPVIGRLARGVLSDMFVTQLKVPAAVAAVVVAVGAAFAWQLPAPPTPPGALPARAKIAAPLAPAPVALQPLMSLTGSDSRVTNREILRIRHADEWKRVWLRHMGVTEQEAWNGRRPVLDVDFQRCEVIAIFRGMTTNRRGILMHSITENANQVTIRYHDTTDPTVGRGDTATAYGFLLIPATTKTVVIEWDAQPVMNQAPVWKEEARLTKAPGSVQPPQNVSANPGLRNR